MSKDKAKPEANALLGTNTIAEMRAALNKQFKEDIASVGFGDEGSITAVEAVPTGIMSFDLATGINGIPLKRVIEVYGPESSGKTTLCLTIVKGFQKYEKYSGPDNLVGYIDVENAIDPDWAESIGVDLSKMLLVQPNNGEQAYDVADTLISSGKFRLVIIDSIAALASKSEIEGTLEDNNAIGAAARLNSKALKKLSPKLKANNCTLLCVNQIREKIGVMFGSPETTPGGRALKFYSSMRVDIRRTGYSKINDVAVGSEVTVKLVKNKLARPFTVADFNIGYGLPQYPVSGIDPVQSLFSVAVEKKIIGQKGSHYNFNGAVLGNGEKNALIALRLDAKAYDEIYKRTMEAIGVKQPANVKPSDLVQEAPIIPDVQTEEPTNTEGQIECQQTETQPTQQEMSST